MKTVIITGANGNLGSAVTQLFLQRGYRVIATVSGKDRINEMPSAENLDVKALDLMQAEATQRFIEETIATYKRIDAVLLLVGGYAMGKVAGMSDDDFDEQVALNFKTALHIARPILPHMLEMGNGRIVFIGSRPALESKQGKDMVAYALSKSLLFKLAEFINEEAKGKNVTATVIVPSTIDTPINRKSMPHANPDDWVTPEKLAEVIEFVVNDNSSVLREAVLKTYNSA